MPIYQTGGESTTKTTKNRYEKPLYININMYKTGTLGGKAGVQFVCAMLLSVSLRSHKKGIITWEDIGNPYTSLQSIVIFFKDIRDNYSSIEI